MTKPVVYGAVAQRPVVSSTAIGQKWSFSFKYFKQIRYFGVDTVDPTWFVSLLDRLKELSELFPEEFFKNRILKDSWRYHEVNWSSTNVPISKSELKWVDKDYLENDQDFPFYQFHISKAKGRVVGFWDKGHFVFNIILLDPLHNIQPAGGKYQYKVDDCYPLSCQYTSLTKDIEDIKASPCKTEGCSVFAEIKKLPKRMNQSNAVVAYLDDDSLSHLNKILEKKTISEIVTMGILASMDN
jgi:hypothetical protein